MSYTKSLPARIYISVNGEGYGHSSRALSVAKYLDRDSVVFGSYGYALERISRAGYRTVQLDPELTFVGKNGSFELSKTAFKNFDLPLVLAEQIREEERIMIEHGISCVISDCRSAAVLAAGNLGLPCLYMTNQTNLDIFFDRPKDWGERLLSKVLEPSFDLFFQKLFRDVNEIIIGDFPAPDAVCLPVLSRRPEVMKLQHMVGPLTQWNEKDIVPQPRPSEGKYVVGTLGGHKFRLPLFNALIGAAKMLPHVNFDILGNFPCDNPPPNVRLIPFVDNPETYYKSADLIVTQAGHSTTMELLSLGKQSIMVPDHRQVEQESNAKRMEELGCASQLVYPDYLSQKILADRITHHLETDRYAHAAERFAKLAAQLDGARTVANIAKEYAKRMTAY